MAHRSFSPFPLLVAVALIVGGSSLALATTPCPTLPAYGFTFDPASGEFELRRPTPEGDLLACGHWSYSSTSVKAHVAGSSDIWTLEAGAPVDDVLTTTITVSDLGSMIYEITFGETFTREITATSISDCEAMSESQTLSAMVGTKDFFADLLSSGAVLLLER